MRRFMILALILGFNTRIALGKETPEIHEENEISVSFGAETHLGSGKTGPGLAITYARTLPGAGFLSVGIEGEAIFYEEREYVLGLITQIHTGENTKLLISPAIAFEGEETEFVVKTGAAYSFGLTKGVELSPTILAIFEGDEVGLSYGLELGIGF